MSISLLGYEVYRFDELSKKVFLKQQKVNSLRRKVSSLSQDLKRKEQTLQELLSQNEELRKKIKKVAKYPDTSSVNEKITHLFIKNRVRLLSLITKEKKEKSGNLNFVLVNLKGEGKEKNVMKLLEHLMKEIPMEVKVLDLSKPERNLVINLVFEVPILKERGTK
ncbi:MAG: hypothetical protein ABGX27_07875 [Desulfurobacteriaceae bacterium]